MLAFDAYKVKDNAGKKEFYDGCGKRTRETSGRDGAGGHIVSEKAASGGKQGSTSAVGVCREVGIEVVYTRTDETADAYIERTVHEIGNKYRVTVATNDGLEQLTVMSYGALRMSAKNLYEEIEKIQW